MPAEWPWLRLYSEARVDKKLSILTDAQHRVWFQLLCFAGEQPKRGEILDVDEYELAVECASGDAPLLRETLYILERLRIVRVTSRDECDIGVTERDECDGCDISFLAWEKRQYDKPSDLPDATAERKRRQREKARRDAALPSNRETSRDVTPGHAPEIEQELDTELEQERERNTPLTPQGGRGSAEQRLAWVLGRVKSGKSTRRDPPPYAAQFEAFWQLVVRKEPSKKEAYWAWLQVLLRGEAPPTPEDVLAGLERMVPVWDRFEDKTKIPHITTWLNQDRWTVERPTGPPRASPAQNGRATAQDFLDLMHEDANAPPGHAETVIDAAYSVSDGQALGAGGKRDRQGVGHDPGRR